MSAKAKSQTKRAEVQALQAAALQDIDAAVGAAVDAAKRELAAEEEQRQQALSELRQRAMQELEALDAARCRWQQEMTEREAAASKAFAQYRAALDAPGNVGGGDALADRVAAAVATRVQPIVVNAKEVIGAAVAALDATKKAMLESAVQLLADL